MKNTRYWLVSWDNLGVEFLEEITDSHPDNWAKKHLFDSIKYSKKIEAPLSFNLSHLVMRAQMNSHRHYEIYVFTSTADIGLNEIKIWTDSDPQGFADWVRENYSYQVFSNRKTTKDVIV